MRRKKVAYNVLSNLALQLVVVLYGFIVPKIIISSFGSNVNGLISSITQFLAYITLLESGFGPVVKSALYKPIAKHDKKSIANILKTSEKFFRKISYIFLFYIVVLCLFYPMIVSSNFEYLYTVSLIVIISIGTFAEYFFGMTYRLYLQADQKTYVISIIQIFTYILSIIVIVILAKMGVNIQLLKLGSGVIFVLRPLLQNLYVKRKYDINFDCCDTNYKLKNKWDGLAQHIASVIHSNTDVTVLTFFCTLTEVSVYSVYYLVVKGIKQIIQAFNNGIDASFGDMMAKNEQENLNKKFGLYEFVYFAITTVIFSSTMVLIVPFVRIYTKGIMDVDYIRPLFGYLIVISEYIWAIRLPYSSITLAAGHFKQTRIGAWVEAIVNIVLSVILVIKFGIIGVTIGTIVGMLIRTIEFIYHTNKYILNRNILVNIKKILIIVLEMVAIVFVCHFYSLEVLSYSRWLLLSIEVCLTATVITLVFSFLCFKKDLKDVLPMILKKRQRKNN